MSTICTFQHFTFYKMSIFASKYFYFFVNDCANTGIYTLSPLEAIPDCKMSILVSKYFYPGMPGMSGMSGCQDVNHLCIQKYHG